ncbi:MAG: septum formation initiator family protein [Calditrichota bacterium]
MAKAKPRRRRKRSLELSMAAWMLIAVFVILVMSAFLTGNSSLINLYKLHQQKLALVEQEKQLEANLVKLRAEVASLEKDMSYIEKVAREEYNLTRADEEIFEIRPE